MNWTRTDTLALSMSSCNRCHGGGLYTSRQTDSAPCNCVLRAIFRACYKRFRRYAGQEKTLSKPTLSLTSSKDRRLSWCRKHEEYIADFYLISKRSLDDEEFRIFRFHYLLGADWRLCCRQLGIDRGIFFHNVYRIQQKLGRAFRETKPYGIFPIDEYLNSVGSPEVSKVIVMKPKGPKPVVPPLRRAA
jgi:hypothetical protein